MKRRILCRPDRAAIPLALAIAASTGRSDASLAIFFWMALARIPTLCMGFALRRAAGTALTPHRLRRYWTFALLITLLGGGLLLFVSAMSPRAAAAFASWSGAAPPKEIWPLAGLGVVLALKDLFAEHLHGHGQAFSAALLEMIAALLLLAAIFLGDARWWFGAGIVALLIAFATGTSIAGNPLAAPHAAPLREIPGAAARELLYPLIAFGLLAAFSRLARIDGNSSLPCAALLIGEAFFCGAQSTFRRSEEESAAVGWWFTLFAGALLIAAAILPALAGRRGEISGCAVLCAGGMLCALWTGTCLRRRALLSLALETVSAALAALFVGNILGWEATWLVPLLSLVAIALRLADARAIFLRARARRLRGKNSAALSKSQT